MSRAWRQKLPRNVNFIRCDKIHANKMNQILSRRTPIEIRTFEQINKMSEVRKNHNQFTRNGLNKKKKRKKFKEIIIYY